MMENSGKMEKIMQNIQDARMDSMMFPATIRVRHGGSCQRTMRSMGGSLSHGATRYHGAFYCDHCNESVLIDIDAPPDIPYQLYNHKEDES